MSRRIRSVAYQAAGGVAPLDGYFDRVIKYIPSDVVGAWIAVTGIIKSLKTGDPNFVTIQWIAFGVGVILTAAWTWRQTSEAGKTTAISQISMSTLAFVVWVVALGGPFAMLPGYQDYYGSLLLIGFTAAAGLVIPKD